MKKELLAGILAAALLISGVATASAAKPQKDSGPNGSIALAADETLQRASATADSGSSVAYMDTISFNTVVENAAAKADVYITVICMQGDDVVYQVSGARDADFLLNDRAGLEWDGAAATCEGWLVHRVKKGKGSEITYLDMVAFDVV